MVPAQTTGQTGPAPTGKGTLLASSVHSLETPCAHGQRSYALLLSYLHAHVCSTHEEEMDFFMKIFEKIFYLFRELIALMCSMRRDE